MTSQNQLGTSIRGLATALETNSQTDAQQEEFLRLAETENFQANEGAVMSESFITILLSLICNKEKNKFVIRSIKVMLDHLKKDASAFRAFKPNKPLLRKIDMGAHIMSNIPAESETALEFCAFIMRYHRNIDYGDFSQSPFVVQRLRRFSEFKTWAEIDDLQTMTESFTERFDEFKSANHGAFSEILAYLDRITKEFTHQDQFKAETSALRSRIQNDIDAQLQIKLSDIDAKRMLNYSMGEEQYKKILQLMLELEKKIESKNIEVRADFTRELQKVAKPEEEEFDHEKFQKDINGQMHNLENHFKNQFMRRIEIVEDAIDSTVGRMDKFMSAVSLDAEKSQKIETALKDQIDLINQLNDKIEVSSDQINRFEEQLDQQIERLRTTLQGEIDGATDGLKKTVQILESEVEQQQEAALANKAAISELQVSFAAGVDTALERQREIFKRAMTGIEDRIELLEETDEAIKSDLAGFIFKNKQAIQMLDQKQIKLVDIIQKMERDLKVQLDQKLQYLEQNDIKVQKELSETYELLRELKTRIGVIATDMDQRLNQFETYYKESIEKMQRGIDKEITELKEGVSKFMGQIWPKMTALDKMDGRFDRMVALTNTQQDQLTDQDTKIKKMQKQVRDFQRAADQMQLIQEQTSDIMERVSELDNIWMFFQKFIDEQGNDIIKIIRGNCYTILEKLNAMEWMARYVEFVTPDVSFMSINYMKQLVFDQDSQMAKQWKEYEHTSEVIPTVLQKLRSKEVEFTSGGKTYAEFTKEITIFINILESLLFNEDNLDGLVKSSGFAALTRYLVAQRTLKDKAGGQTGQELDSRGRLLPAANAGLKQSYDGLVAQDDFVDGNGNIILLESTKPLLRCFTLAFISPSAQVQFIADPGTLQQVVDMAEEFGDEEIISNAMKIIRQLVESETTRAHIFNSFPNLFAWMIHILTSNLGSQAIVNEGALALRIGLQNESKIKDNSYLKPGQVRGLVAAISAEPGAMRSAELQGFMKELYKYPSLEGIVGPLFRSQKR